MDVTVGYGADLHPALAVAHMADEELHRISQIIGTLENYVISIFV